MSAFTPYAYNPRNPTFRRHPTPPTTAGYSPAFQAKLLSELADIRATINAAQPQPAVKFVRPNPLYRALQLLGI